MQRTQIKNTDFEKLGFDTMLETSDENLATRICGLHLHAYAEESRPRMQQGGTEIAHCRNQHAALRSLLYERTVPANDARLLARSILWWVVAVLFSLSGLTSVGGHITTFYLFGLGLLLNSLLGLGITGLVTAVGYQAFEKIFSQNKALETLFVVLPIVLCGWGLLQLAQARGAMVQHSDVSAAPTSFVDGGQAEDALPESSSADSSLERKIQNSLGSAMVKIMLSADLAIGMMLSLLLSMRSDEDFTAWRNLSTIVRHPVR